MQNGPTAVIVAIFADVVIAGFKFTAAFFSRSSALFSEGIHSVADIGNGLLLLLGIRQSRRPPDEEHPFGHGKELYFWTLVIAMLVFAGGGTISIAEGVSRLRHPLPLEHSIWNYAVLMISAICEGYSLRIAHREFRKSIGEEDDLWSAIRRSKDPSNFTVLFEDTAALLGILIAFIGTLLAQLLGNSAFDAVASICIGLMLLLAAILLANETRGLLTGEAVRGSTVRRICEIVQGDPAVERARTPMTMYLGPDSVLLALDIQFRPTLSAIEVTQAVDRIENAVRSRFPRIKHIFIEAEAITAVARAPENRAPDRVAAQRAEPNR